MRIDRGGWSGDGALTQTVVERLRLVPELAGVKVEDAPSSREDAGYNLIANDIFVTIAEHVRFEPVRRFGVVPWARRVRDVRMTFDALAALLAESEGIGPADYADEGMIQYLRTERIVAPYQTRGYKLVELVRIYRANG